MGTGCRALRPCVAPPTALRTTVALLIAGLLGTAAVAQPPGALNVRDFGARGDGKTDDTTAFQRALDAMAPAGGPVFAPGARYLLAGHLRVPSGVTLCGSWLAPPSRESGTVLLATEGAGSADGPPFVTLEGAAAIQGLVITYPNQSGAAPPTPYPWTIRGLAEDCRVQDVLLIRSYQGIDFGTHACSRHIIRGVWGSPLRRGIYVDGSVDVGRISDVHFSTWGFPYRGALDQWKLQNLEAFVIGKADWEWFSNCFAIGCKVGFRFVRGAGGSDKRAGPPNYVAITRCGIDESASTMVIEDSSGVTVSQSVFKGHAIDIRPTNTGPVKFAECWFSPMPGTESLVEAAGHGRVSFTDCTFEFWDTLGRFAPALRASCPSVSVQGCEFGTHNRAPFLIGKTPKRQIELLPTVRSAAIVGNRFRYGLNVVNRARGQVRMAENVTDDYDLPEYRAPQPR